ncbi:MAG TPA: hypothetical protein VGH27_33910 [Streptosporangiaceae bacterium]
MIALGDLPGLLDGQQAGPEGHGQPSGGLADEAGELFPLDRVELVQDRLAVAVAAVAVDHVHGRREQPPPRRRRIRFRHVLLGRFDRFPVYLFLAQLERALIQRSGHQQPGAEKAHPGDHLIHTGYPATRPEP